MAAPARARGAVLRDPVLGALRALDARRGTDYARTLRLAAGLARAASGGRHRLGVLRAGVVFGSGRARPVTLHVRGPRGLVPFVVPDRAAFEVLAQTFLIGEYDVAPATEPRAILDLGAHIGASCLFFRLRHPAARIVAVEPNPALLPLLRRNTAALGVEVRAAAVSAAPGTVEFHPHAESWYGHVAPADGSGVAVDAVPLDELIAEDVDLVKLDVEGAEFDAVPASRRLPGVPTVVGEVHAPPEDPRTRAVLATLARHEIEIAPQAPGFPFTVFRATWRQ